MDSSHHRLSDKVNCDLTLGLISGLFPAVKWHRTRIETVIYSSRLRFSVPIVINLSPSSDSQYASAAGEPKCWQHLNMRTC
jgi:hypothetical protein